MDSNRDLIIIVIIVTILADINDIFRPLWFYKTITQVLFWNILSLVGLISILIEINKNKCVKHKQGESK